MDFFKKIFRRKREKKAEPQPLRIEGCKTELTPEPDDAELAAQALLEAPQPSPRPSPQPLKGRTAPKDAPPSGGRGADYYRELGDRIKLAHEHDARMAMRYVSYVEEQLAHCGQTPRNPASPDQTGDSPRSAQQDSSLFTLYSSLYKHQDAVEREGGELLKRWQHCLAECIVRELNTESTEKTTTDLTD